MLLIWNWVRIPDGVWDPPPHPPRWCCRWYLWLPLLRCDRILSVAVSVIMIVAIVIVVFIIVIVVIMVVMIVRLVAVIVVSLVAIVMSLGGKNELMIQHLAFGTILI